MPANGIAVPLHQEVPLLLY